MLKTAYHKLWDTVRATQKVDPEEKNTGIAKCANICYGKDKKNNKFDFYYPKNISKPLPTIFVIHGGGYISGQKEFLARYCQMLAQNNCCVVNVEYTRADGEEKKYFLDQLDELYTMFKFVKNSKVLSPMIDFDNVFLAGDSAGAHYASLITNIQNREDLQKEFNAGYSPKVKGLILVSPCFGVFQFNNFPIKNEYEHVIFGPKETRSPLCEKTHCIELLDKDFPPCIMVSAKNDFVVGTHRDMFLKKAQELELTVKHYNVVKGYKLFHDAMINYPSHYPLAIENINKFVNDCVNGTLLEGFENTNISEAVKTLEPVENTLAE